MLITKILSPLYRGVKTIKNTSAVKKGIQYGKTNAKSVFEMKDIFLKNKNKGAVTALKMVIKEKGVCAPVLTGGGVIAGTFLTPIPGAGLIGAVGGYIIGHGLDKGVVKVGKSISKIIKK